MALAGHPDFATMQGYIDLAGEVFRHEASGSRSDCSSGPAYKRECVAWQRQGIYGGTCTRYERTKRTNAWERERIKAR